METNEDKMVRETTEGKVDKLHINCITLAAVPIAGGIAATDRQ